MDVKLKLRYSSENEINRFLSYLRSHSHVIEIFTISGEWDLSIVIIAKDAIDLGKITKKIRFKFGNLITSWTEALTTDSLKFEYYDMSELMGYGPSKIKFNF